MVCIWNINSDGIFRKGYSDKKETVVKTDLNNQTMLFRQAVRFLWMTRAAFLPQNPTVSQPFPLAKVLQVPRPRKRRAGKTPKKGRMWAQSRPRDRKRREAAPENCQGATLRNGNDRDEQSRRRSVHELLYKQKEAKSSVSSTSTATPESAQAKQR